MITFRKAMPPITHGKTCFANYPDPVLMFDRVLGGARVTCVFNLSPGTHSTALPVALRLTGPHQQASLSGRTLTLGANGFAYLNAQEPL